MGEGALLPFHCCRTRPDADQQGRQNAECLCQCRRGGTRHARRRPAGCSGPCVIGRGQNEGHHTGPDAGERTALYPRGTATDYEMSAGNEQDDEKRRAAPRRAWRPDRPRHAPAWRGADERGHVDGQRARGGLRHRHKAQKLRLRSSQPWMEHGLPDQRDHAVAAAKGDGTDGPETSRNNSRRSIPLTSRLSDFCPIQPDGHADRAAEQDAPDGRKADCKEGAQHQANRNGGHKDGVEASPL